MKAPSARVAVVVAALVVAACDTNGAGGAYGTPPADSFTAKRAELTIAGAPIAVDSAAVTPSFFRAARAQPMLGRFFLDADATGSSVVVVSEEFWRRHLQASPSIIGSTVRLDGQSAIVIGVAPPRFSYPGSTSVWTPR